jgi:hypothetical protein
MKAIVAGIMSLLVTLPESQAATTSRAEMVSRMLEYLDIERTFPSYIVVAPARSP